jgi:opacity protein-like surface antigen
MPAEQQYRHFSDIRQEFNTVMFNFFYDIPVYPKIYPYGGVGVGGTYVKNEVQYSGTEKKLCFSFAGDLGVSFEVAKHLNLDTGIRVTYLGGMPIEFTDYYMYAIDMYFGLRYMV